MSTSSTTPSPGLGTRIKNLFITLGKKMEEIGTDALKDIGIIQKDVNSYAPMVLATIQEMFPKANIPTAKINNIIANSLTVSQSIASALQAEGLNPTLDQTAAIQTAVAIHSLSANPSSVLPASGATPAS